MPVVTSTAGDVGDDDDDAEGVTDGAEDDAGGSVDDGAGEVAEGVTVAVTDSPGVVRTETAGDGAGLTA